MVPFFKQLGNYKLGASLFLFCPNNDQRENKVYLGDTASPW